MTIQTAQWYSVASLSPNPELNERYAFGAVVCDATRLKLEIGREISGSFTFLPAEQRTAFKVLVSALEQDLERPESFETVVRAYGPQIVFSEKTPILVQVTPKIVSQLLNSWFDLEKPEQAKRIEHIPEVSYKAIEGVLRKIAPPFGTKLLPKASPHKLGYGLRDRTIRVDQAEVDYAISTTDKDLLLSAVDLNLQSGVALSSKTIRASKAFWFWKNNRVELQRRAKREFRTIGVVVNGVHDEHLKEWSEFINHIWTADCDRVRTTHSQELEDVLSSEISWLLR